MGTGNVGSGNALRIQGKDVDTAAPTADQVLIWDSGAGKYVPKKGSGSGIDADLLDGSNSSTAPAASSIPKSAATKPYLGSGWGSPTILAAGYDGSTATGSGDKILNTVTIPAGLLGTTNGVQFVFSVRRSTGVGTMTLKLGVKGSPVLTSTVSANGYQTGAGFFYAEGSTSAQRSFMADILGGLVSGTTSEDSTADIDLQFMVSLGTGSDVATLEWLQVLLLEP